MFSGKVVQRSVSMAGSKRNKRGKRGRREVLAKAKAERAGREARRRSEAAALKVETWFRGVRARKAFAVKQRQHLDQLLKAAGLRFQRLAAAGKSYVADVEGELCRIIQAYNSMARHSGQRGRETIQDFSRLCNLGRLVLASCASSDPRQNIRHVLVTHSADSIERKRWLERLHFLCRCSLACIVIPEFRQRPEAMIPVQVISRLLRREGTSTQTQSPAEQNVHPAEQLSIFLSKALLSQHSLGPNLFEALAQLSDDRQPDWLSSKARATSVNIIASSIVAEFSGLSENPSQSGTSRYSQNFDALARSCLVRPLMANNRDLYKLILMPLLNKGGAHFWRGTLHAALRLVTHAHGDSVRDISALDRMRLAANIISVTSGLLPKENKATSKLNLCDDMETLATYVRLLAHLIPEIPTNMLLSREELARRQKANLAEKEDSSSDEDDSSGLNNGEVKYSSSATSSSSTTTQNSIVRFAPAQEQGDDPSGAAARLLRGIDFTDALRHGKALQSHESEFSKMGDPGHDPIPVGCESISRLISPTHASMLFDSILPNADATGSSSQNSSDDRADIVLALTSLYDVIFTRMDVLRSKPTDILPPSGAALFLINTLAFDSRLNLITRLWHALQSAVDLNLFAGRAQNSPSTFVQPILSSQGGNAPMKKSSPLVMLSHGTDAVESAVCLFCTCYSHLLLSLTDIDIYELGRPFPMPVQEGIVRFLSRLLHRLCWDEELEHIQAPFYPMRRLRLLIAAMKLFNQLYERNCRRPFCSRVLFLWEDLPLTEFHKAAVGVGGARPAQMAFRAVLLLSSLPQTVPFDERVAVFEQLLANDRAKGGHHHDIGPRTQVRIRRDHAVEDAMNSLPRDGVTLKHRVQITFVDSNGNTEDGIDGGGLFKEFVDVVTKEAFSPDYGMFIQTSNEGHVYPNPASGLITTSHLDVFEFMGRLLGKALYESTLVEPRFAAFFLNKLLGRPNYVDDLRSLDADLHKQLLSITQLPDASDLDLTFSFLEDKFGMQEVVELEPGGSDVVVTNSNRHRYIAAMAFHYLHTRIAIQSRAFRRGLNKMVPVRWIRMFSQSELQHLIGGASESFDIQDMKKFCKYGSGYHQSQPYIQGFWEVVESFTPEQRAKLLKFTTSCSRPPLLGFKKLYPPFCIQKITIQSDADRLPIAATCYNLLKLPLYSSVSVMRDKLLFAINEGGEGFGLS